MVKTHRSIRKSGQRTKADAAGKRKHYITRSRALQKLQLSLKDFRRLCILKGIFPREAPKGKDKSKVYYHEKDIAFMSHERLIDKFRSLKTFMKRRSRLHNRYESDDAARLNRPQFHIDHLVRERYPTLLDALRDLDDPISMITLFNVLRVKVHASYTQKNASMVSRLNQEWTHYISQTFSLRKVFVSIKGYYFQAVVKGVIVTWLMPHQTMQNAAANVDYEVISAFLQFYLAMLRCVHFKLYKEDNMAYPLVQGDETERTAEFITQYKEQQKQKNTVSTSKTSKKAKKAAAPVSAAVASALAAEKAASNKNIDDQDEDAVDQTNGDTEQFQSLDPSLQLSDENAESCKKTFAGAVFLVGRETAFEPISLVIRCGGGVAIPETALPSYDDATLPVFTHQVVDRPITASFNQLVGRAYVQPQWIFDSFNMRAQLPVSPYAPGQKLPPHLSPFVDDVREQYIPEQLNQLRAWVGLPPLKQAELARIRQTEEEKQQAKEAAEEANYQKDLAKERAGKAHADDEGSDIELDLGNEYADYEDDGDESDIIVEDVSGDEQDMDDEDDEIDIEEAKILAKPKPAPKPEAFNPRDNDQQLAKIVMKKNDKRLHDRMIFGINEQKKKARVLVEKREAAAQGIENPQLSQVSSRMKRKR